MRGVVMRQWVPAPTRPTRYVGKASGTAGVMLADKGAEPWFPSGGGIEDLRRAAAACEGCELYRDVYLGATAMRAVLGRGGTVSERRGSVEDGVLVTIHPSAVLRVDDRATAYAGLKADLAVAVQALG